MLLSFGTSPNSCRKACGFIFSQRIFNILTQGLDLEGDIEFTDEQLEAVMELQEAIIATLLKHDEILDAYREEAMLRTEKEMKREDPRMPVMDGEPEIVAFYGNDRKRNLEAPQELLKLVYGLSELYHDSREGLDSHGGLARDTLICRAREGDCEGNVLNDALRHLLHHFETSDFADRIVRYCGLLEPKGKKCKGFSIKEFNEDWKSSEEFFHDKWYQIDKFFKEYVCGGVLMGDLPEMRGHHWTYLKAAVYYTNLPEDEWRRNITRLVMVMDTEFELCIDWIVNLPHVREKGRKAFDAFGEDIEGDWQWSHSRFY
jgi:hypothetical protein